MTNRKLKKKIRQAFKNATPDLTETLVVSSLLSDVEPKKADEQPLKPIKTSIQFRAIATLAASIAVVALLIGLLPRINPFIDPSTNGPGPEPTFNDTQTSPLPLKQIIDAIYATQDLSIPRDDAAVDVDIKSFEDNRFYDIEIKSINPENADEYHFLTNLNVTSVFPYNEDFDWTPFLSTKYFDIPVGPDILFNPLAKEAAFDAEFVLYNDKLCYALAIDFGNNGQFVLINAQTEKLSIKWMLIGSNEAAEIAFGAAPVIFEGENSDWDSFLGTLWEWEFAYFDGKLCYELTSDTLKSEALVNAVTGEVVYSFKYDDVVDPSLVTTPPNTDPHNTDGPPIQTTTPIVPEIDEQEALYTALAHAGLQKNDITDYRIEQKLTEGAPRYEVEFYNAEYEYEYEISLTNGVVFRMEREYVKKVNSDDSLNLSLDEEDVVWIVKNDPMIGFDVYRMSVVDPGKDAPCYLVTCQTSQKADQSDYCYIIKVSKQYGIVMELELIYTNQFMYTDYYSDAQKTGYGNISNDTAVDAALFYADKDIYDVGSVYCDQGMLDNGIYTYNAHYNVYFYYEGCKYNCYVELKTGRLLSIEIQATNSNSLPDPEVIMSQWVNLKSPMPNIVTTNETDMELLRETAPVSGHYLYIKTDSGNQKLVDSSVSWSVDTGNGAIYISADKRSVYAVSYRDRNAVEIYRCANGDISAPDYGVNLDLERQWLVIRDGDTLVQLDLAAGKSRRLVSHQNMLPHYYIDHGETTVYFEVSAGLDSTGYTIDMQTGKLTEDSRL